MLLRKDFLLPLESSASLYDWIEEGHLKHAQLHVTTLVCARGQKTQRLCFLGTFVF